MKSTKFKRFGVAAYSSDGENEHDDNIFTKDKSRHGKEKKERYVEKEATEKCWYICIDASGSTKYQKMYWNSVDQIVRGYIGTNSEYRVLIWDHFCNKVNIYAAFEIIRGRGGSGYGGGTDPSSIIKFLSRKCSNRLLLITDGEVAESTIRKCDEMIQSTKLRFSQVDCHFISTGSDMNLSVSSPFTRSCRYRVFVDGQLIRDDDSSFQLNFDFYAHHPYLFLKDFDQIYSNVAMKTRGIKHFGIRNSVLKLQNDLIKNLAQKSAGNANQGSIEERFEDIRDIISSGVDHDTPAVEIMSDLLTTLEYGENQKIAKFVDEKIQVLINLCDKHSDFDFSILKPNRVERANEVDKVNIDETNSNASFGSSVSYECPITCEDDEMPCLLIAESEDGFAVTKHMDADQLEGVMNMPLFMLCKRNEKELKKLVSKMDHVVGLQAAKKLFDQKHNVRSPFTRKKVECALTFGHDKIHDKANNYALSKIFFPNCKLVGLAEFWLCVIYFAIQQNVTYLSNHVALMEAFKSYIVYRMKKYRSYLTLTGLAVEPIVRAPIDISIWYTIASPRIRGQSVAAENRLRSFRPATKFLVKILENILDYSFQKEWTKHQLALYAAFAWMMKMEKANSDWRKLVKAQYQGSLITPKKRLILIDGPAFEAENSALGKMKKFKNISLGEILALAELVDRNKTTNNVPIPNNLIPIEVIPKPVVNYGYPQSWTEDYVRNLQIIPICSTTCRPYLHDVHTRNHWKIELMKKLGHETDRYLSLFNLFGRFVTKFDRFPRDKWEFIFWVSQIVERSSAGYDTLPTMIIALVDVLYKSYEAVFGNGFVKIAASKFKSSFSASIPIIKRTEIEADEL